MNAPAADRIDVRTHDRLGLPAQLARWEAFVAARAPLPLSYHPAWPLVLGRGLRQAPYCLEAVEGGRTRGLLPLSYVRSLLFGRYLVGLPYLNYGGVLADDEAAARLLIDRAVAMADRLGVRHLELRHERAVEHPALSTRAGAKVHMRLPLPKDADGLWKAIHSKVRNQIRKGQRCGLAVAWGGEESLPAFYDVFSRNMRDLGTPVFAMGLFRAILRQFPGRAELCVVRDGPAPVAAALLLHGWGVTEVPSASSLRESNASNANMLMYWHLLERAILRGQASFDFGRSTPDSGTYRFKKQWGAAAEPAEWQYHVRVGDSSDMRPDNPKYRRIIDVWKRLPVRVTRWVGPAIVRGIP